jgi:RNA polymerase sigma factor (sigma-70 family)
LQETFFSAWRALERYQGDRPFEFWLRRIALNKCRDRNRRETVRRFIGAAARADETALLVDSAPGPAELVGADQEVRRLEQQLRKLPRSLQEPLLLTALEGLTQQQAGQVLGISAKAIETKIYRARLRLAELYGLPR